MRHRFRTSLAAGAVGLALTVSLPTADAAPTYRSPHAALFRSPIGMAFDLYRNAYVLDASGKIVKLSPLGRVLNTFGNTGQLRGPSGITADAFGHVYVVDSGDAKVHVFSYAGKQLGTFGGHGTLASPASAAIDAGGRVYVADMGHSRIAKFSNGEQLMAGWNGVNGTRPQQYNLAPVKRGKGGKKVALPRSKPIKTLNAGRFYRPRGVSVEFNGNVWVSDTGHNRVVELTATGLPIRIIRASLRRPTGLAPDGRGNVWIVDSGNNRVLEVSARGATVRTIGGTRGSAQGHFSNPRDVALDAHGDVYVVDTGNARVQKFSSSGQVLGIWK